jgi:hypothetical protein
VQIRAIIAARAMKGQLPAGTAAAFDFTTRFGATAIAGHCPDGRLGGVRRNRDAGPG